MFIENKYHRIYQALIERARARTLTGYKESHHAIPVSLGGTDDDRVDLTAREHYIAHRLLVKITEGEHRSKMLFALWRMSNQPNRTILSSVYARLREEHAVAIKDLNTGRKYPNRKRPAYSEEARAKRAEVARRTIEMRRARGDFDKPLSEETKAKIREARAKQDMSHLKGRKRSEKTRAKIRAARALQTNVRNQYSSSPPK